MKRTIFSALLISMMILQSVPAMAAQSAPADRLTLLTDLLQQRQTSASGSQATFQESAGYTDPADDETDIETRENVDEPRVDILTHSVDYTSDELTLTVSVDTPTDPNTDPAWEQNTLLGWFLDTDGDNEGEFFVDYSLAITGSEQLEVLVREVENGAVSMEPRCRGTASYDGDFQAVVPSDCIDDPDSLAVNPGFLFQADDTSITTNDFAPNTGRFEDPVDVEQIDDGGMTPDPEITDRFDGETRIETAVLGSQFEFPNGSDVVYLARQDIFADAVSGGTLTGGPILLVPTCGPVPQVVLDEVNRLGVSQVIALGGVDAICDQVLDDVTAAAPDGATSDRYAGPDRFSTSVAISQAQFPANSTNVFLARADVFADAVAGGVLTSGPILLVPNCGDIPSVVLDEIRRLVPTAVYALGGTAAICDATLQEAGSASPTVMTVDRLAGPTRIDTAVAISQFEFADGEADIVFLSRQDVLADAVSAGGLTGGPVLLVPTCGELPTVVANEINRVGADTVIALGGINAICDDLLAQAGNVISSR